MIIIGTSGWQYSDWRGVLYPASLPVHDWLRYYSQEFACVEVNMTFYRMPKQQTVAGWAAATPERFRFCVKLNRTITHLARLRDARSRIPSFVDAMAPLGNKLGALLMQLPPSLAYDLDLLEQALAAFPPKIRVAVEFRHDSWWRDETLECLADHRAALCYADRAETHLSPLWVTTSWCYARLHEGAGEDAPSYTQERLLEWAGLLAANGRPSEGFFFFNNDTRGCAVRDARRLRSIIAEINPTNVT